MKGNPVKTLPIIHWKVEPVSFPQNKGHPNELKESKRSNDGSLRNVVREHLDLVVALHKVKGGEHMGASHVFAEC